jgi:N-acetylglutamate synthase-like GNAT family acetyltransferase
VMFERNTLSIVEYSDALAADFSAINIEWIEAMFAVEEADRETLTHPRQKIIDPGGAILFVAAADLGIVGACALQRTGDRAYELTKMGVRGSVRGRKAGEFLLEAMIDRARTMGAQSLYLLTNRKCAAAIHLYEKLGFVHDARIMAAYSARYERCDVAMSFPVGDQCQTVG